MRSWIYRWWGLTPLQRLVYKYNQFDEPGRYALGTYGLFLTYEAEVLAAIKKAKGIALAEFRKGKISQSEADNILAEAEKQAYLGISSALRASKNPANHNVRWKTALHLLGFGLLSVLMLVIAYSNTLGLMDFLKTQNADIGAYTNVFTGFVYVASLCAQWMIFRKGIPKMLKALFARSNGQQDFFESRSLEFKKEYDPKQGKLVYALCFEQNGQPNNGESNHKLPGHWSRRFRAVFYGLCTGTISLSWGVLIYNKLAGGLDDPDGMLRLSGAFAENFAMVAGVIVGCSAFLLWMRALRDDLKAEERLAKEGKPIPGFLDNLLSLKFTKPKMLYLMLGVTFYGLLSSVLWQTKVTFDTFDWNTGIRPGGDGVLMFMVFLGAAYLGRQHFSGKNMEYYYTTITETWAKIKKNVSDYAVYLDRSCLLSSFFYTNKPMPDGGVIKREFDEYGSHYAMGTALITSVAIVFITSFFVEKLQDPLCTGRRGLMTPMGITVLGAVLAWVCFLVGKRRFSYESGEQADKEETRKESVTDWFSDNDFAKGYGPTSMPLSLAAGVGAGAFASFGGRGGDYAGNQCNFGEDGTKITVTAGQIASFAQSASNSSAGTTRLKPRSNG